MGKKSSSWYKRHVSDEFVKQANKENWRSRAVFKLKEIDTKYDLIKRKSNILDLGAAPGGISGMSLVGSEYGVGAAVATLHAVRLITVLLILPLVVKLLNLFGVIKS